DEVLARGRFSRRRRAFAAVLRNPFFGLGGGAVVDRDVMSALRLEMSCHRVAHHAEPDKRHLRHCFLHHPVAGLSAANPGPTDRLERASRMSLPPSRYALRRT